MSHFGDVMVNEKDTTLGQTREFDAQIQVKGSFAFAFYKDRQREGASVG